jgi:hypothetical protein
VQGQVIAFVQANLVLILSFALVAVAFYALGLLTRRRHVIQILPAPVSPGLERAISAALSSREIVYVQQAPAPVAPSAVIAAAPAPAAPVSEVITSPSTAGKHALSTPKEIEHEIGEVASKLAHEDSHALDGAAKDALLGILAHMEHHADDDWFAAMKDKLEHAKSNEDLAHCAAEMVKHMHDVEHH